jgi:hypothetical protein
VPADNGRGVLTAGDAVTAGLDTDQANAGDIDIGIEDTDCVGTAANACHYRIRLAAESCSGICTLHSSPITHWKSRTILG